MLKTLFWKKGMSAQKLCFCFKTHNSSADTLRQGTLRRKWILNLRSHRYGLNVGPDVRFRLPDIKSNGNIMCEENW
jgi:hypothetical protein